MKSPQLVAFQLCRKKAIDTVGSGNVYDFLPDSKAQYPFFYIGEMQSVDRNTKNAQIPTIYQTIHYYSANPRKRGSDTQTIIDFMERLRLTTKYETFKVDCKNINLQMGTDNSTSTPLLHAVIDVEFIMY